MSATRALFRQSFRDGRTRTLSFAGLFFVAALMQAAAYDQAYPTLEDKAAFAASFGQNAGIRIFYGVPHDLLTSGGYVSWRVGGTLGIFLSVWGLLAGVRARAEEDAGRQELVLAGPVSRRLTLKAFAAAVTCGAALIMLAGAAAAMLGGLAIPGSLYLGLQGALVGLFFAAVGTVTAQIAPSRRIALGIGLIVFAASFLLRVVADTIDSADWLRWLTPMGWAEEMRPFVGARYWPALLLVVGALLLVALAMRLQLRRDIGSGLIGSHDRREAKLGLLGSPVALALRLERATIIAWIAGTAAIAVIFAAIAHSVTSGLTDQVENVVKNFGAAGLSAQVYIGFLFVLYVFAACLFVCSHLTVTRHEEAEGRLETELAEPVSRHAWLSSRMAIALLGVLGIALAAALFSWAGANATGTKMALGDLLVASVNCLPSALLVLGLGALVFATVPRATSGVAYGLVSAAFVWWMLGTAIDAPAWLLDLTPFSHVALVPVQDFKVVPALIMSAIGLVGCAAALPLFRRRDLVGA
jgi:ABC-2 type transport system permease protein